jgi:hypothetical protein
MRPQRLFKVPTRAHPTPPVGSHQGGAVILAFSARGLVGDRIHAYVDRLLSPRAAAEFDDALRHRPFDRVRVAAYRVLNAELNMLFGDQPPAMSAALSALADRTIDRFADDEEAPLVRQG